jgi:hypothetical protein
MIVELNKLKNIVVIKLVIYDKDVKFIKVNHNNTFKCD